MRIPNWNNYGTIANQVKQIGLQQKFQFQKNTSSESSARQSEFDRMQKQMEQEQKSSKINGITMKLRAGETLSNEELEYLQTESPELYREALELKREKEAYEKALRQCRSKEDAERLHRQKTEQLLSQLGKGQTAEQISGKLQAMRIVFGKFLRSQQYRSLPEKRQKGSKNSSVDKRMESTSISPPAQKLKQAITSYTRNYLLDSDGGEQQPKHGKKE